MSNYEIALEVISGKWGNNEDRKRRLTEAGYNYAEVQKIVNAIIAGTYKPEPAEPEMLEVDFDPEKHKGIQINIIV